MFYHVESEWRILKYSGKAVQSGGDDLLRGVGGGDCGKKKDSHLSHGGED